MHKTKYQLVLILTRKSLSIELTTLSKCPLQMPNDIAALPKPCWTLKALCCDTYGIKKTISTGAFFDHEVIQLIRNNKKTSQLSHSRIYKTEFDNQYINEVLGWYRCMVTPTSKSMESTKISPDMVSCFREEVMILILSSHAPRLKLSTFTQNVWHSFCHCKHNKWFSVSSILDYNFYVFFSAQNVIVHYLLHFVKRHGTPSTSTPKATESTNLHLV